MSSKIRWPILEKNLGLEICITEPLKPGIHLPLADRLNSWLWSNLNRAKTELKTVPESLFKVTNVDNEEPRVNQTVVLEIKYKEISWKRYCNLP